MGKEWQYHVARGFGKFLCCLPYPLIISLGRTLGPFVGKLMKKQRERGIFQIQRGLECSRPEAEAIMTEVFRNLGQSLMEILYTPRLNPDNIRQYVTLDHPERLDEAMKEDKGVIVLTAHMGNWEWLGALAMYGYPASTIVKNQANSAVTRLLNEIGKAWDLKSLPAAVMK